MNTLIVQLLEWIAARPRTYGDTMDAWRTSCPRMPVWEDATSDGLIEVIPSAGAGMREAAVRLTPSGRALLASVAHDSGTDDGRSGSRTERRPSGTGVQR
jgi:hypothetical protein